MQSSVPARMNPSSSSSSSSSSTTSSSSSSSSSTSTALSNARMAASSVAVLTQAFDFDLHLENEKTTSPLLSSRSMNFLYIAVTLALLSPLLYLHPLQFSVRQPQTSINNAITDQISERLEQTKDLNEQISSRMNILNDTISSLRSRVFEVEKKPLISNIDVFVAAKSKIDESLKSLKTRIEAQSKKWDETIKIQQRTAAELEKTRIARSLEISATNTVITNIEGKFTGLRSKIEAVTTSQISITQTRLIAHKQLLQEVAKLEERFQSALENAGDVFSYMKGDLEFAFNDTTSSWDRVASSSYSDAFVESIVRDVWTENEEAYQDALPNRVCPRSPAPVAAATSVATPTAAAPIILDVAIDAEIKPEAEIISQITPASSTSKNTKAGEKAKEKEVEKEKEKEKEREREKEKEKPIPVAAVIPPDFARRVAGAHIILEGTSATYIHPERNLKHYSNRLLKYFGISKDSYICNNRIVDQLSQYTDSITPFLTNALGLNNGIGSPEDIISPDMSLGSCWPMQGNSGVIMVKLSQPIFVDSVSIDHISREHAIDLRSAPKDFQVFGSSEVSDSRDDYSLLARGTYNISGTYASSQTFKATVSPEPTEFISLKILNNHGNNNYTCVYRLRVHGTAPK